MATGSGKLKIKNLGVPRSEHMATEREWTVSRIADICERLLSYVFDYRTPGTSTKSVLDRCSPTHQVSS